MSKVTRDITSKIKIEGDQEYRQKLSQINQTLGNVKAEMYKVTTEYQNNAKSVEALSEKHRLLEAREREQADRVAILTEMLEKAKAKYGEASKEVSDLTDELNYSTGAWNKTVAEIEKCDEELENANKSIWDFAKETKGMGDILDSVGSKFGVSLPDSVKSSMNSFASFSAVGVGAVTAVIAVVKKLVDAEKALVQLTTEQASNADEILTMAQITGLDTDTIQEMQYASELIDVSFDTIKGSMTKLKRNMDSARDGNEELTESFADLGVAITGADGQLRSSEDVFYDTIDALGQIDNATERDTVAMKLLGKSAEELNPLIIQGTDTLKAYAEESHNVGAVMTEDELSALGAVDDAYQRLQETQDAMKQQIAIEMAPTVEKFYTEWTEFTRSATEALINSGVLEYMGNLLSAVADLFEPIGSLISSVLPALKVALAGVAGVIALIADAVNVIVGLLSGDWDKVATALGANTSKGQLSNYQQTKYNYTGYDTTYSEEAGGYVGNYFNAGGNQNFGGGLTWVGENGAELVNLPQGSQIFNNQDSRNLGNNIYNISINASEIKEFNDIIRIAQNSRMTARMRA